MDSFGNRFKGLRFETGYSQGDMLKDFNKKYHRAYTLTAVSLYENNKRMPEIDALRDFADYFHVSVSYLLGDSDTRDPDGKYAPQGQAAAPGPGQTPDMSPGEHRLIAAAREQIMQGRAWPDLEAAIELEPDAIQIAKRWAALDDDSRAIVRTTLIQEERRATQGIEPLRERNK